MAHRDVFEVSRTVTPSAYRQAVAELLSLSAAAVVTGASDPSLSNSAVPTAKVTRQQLTSTALNAWKLRIAESLSLRVMPEEHPGPQQRYEHSRMTST